MHFTYYGHSCFLVEVNGIKLLFDPFMSANPLAKQIDVHTIQADYILLSHGHADHILDCESIALRTGAKVICSWEIHEWLHKKGVTNTHPMNTGGKKVFDEFTVKCVVAQHSSGLPDGTYGGNPMGFIVYANKQSFYFAGDTALTMDMQLIPLWAKLDVALLPIGDNFTMDVNDAVKAAELVQCKKVLGMHFDTFGFIVIDKADAKETFRQAGIDLVLMEIGGSLMI